MQNLTQSALLQISQGWMNHFCYEGEYREKELNDTLDIQVRLQGVSEE